MWAMTLSLGRRVDDGKRDIGGKSSSGECGEVSFSILPIRLALGAVWPDTASSSVGVGRFELGFPIADLVKQPLADFGLDSLADELTMDLDSRLAPAPEAAHQGSPVGFVIQKTQFHEAVHHLVDDLGGVLRFSSVMSDTSSGASIEDSPQARHTTGVPVQVPSRSSLEVGLGDGRRRLFPLTAPAFGLRFQFFVDSFSHGASRTGRKIMGER